MQQELQKLISKSLEYLLKEDIIEKIPIQIKIEHTKDKQHGDYATNIALVLCKDSKYLAKDLAKEIIARIEHSPIIKKIAIAGPGFINFFLSEESNSSIIKNILQLKTNYGHSNIGQGKKILLEFVSANPTGPLHVGHGRGAAYGATIANLMRVIGFKVDNEYYVNDAGRQMDILAVSIFLRYISLFNKQIIFPENGYQGRYIKNIAKKIFTKDGDLWLQDDIKLFLELYQTEPQEKDQEKHIDNLIKQSKELLQDNFKTFFKAGMDFILSDIKKDLSEFGIEYQKWFSELYMKDNNLIKKIIKKLQNKSYIYEKDNALWLKTSQYGDQKDRVVVRDNGIHTYFAADIAYHFDKFNRDYDKIINIWGADHHGYIDRIKASIKALGNDAEKLTILLVQFANLYKGKEKVPMSTRSGSFITLRELREEVGKDATRFFYILRKSDQHMDFDINLAKSQSNDNPVFYIQYAHARICSVIKQAQQENIFVNINADLSLLSEKDEKSLIKELNRYNYVLESAALQYEPHQLAYYLKDLATNFHRYYNSLTFIIKEDIALTEARLALISASRQILANGLELLGVSAPESM